MDDMISIESAIETTVLILWWFCHTVWTIGIANNMNRNLTAWTILGIFFGPLAFGTVLALPKVKKRKHREDG